MKMESMTTQEEQVCNLVYTYRYTLHLRTYVRTSREEVNMSVSLLLDLCMYVCTADNENNSLRFILGMLHPLTYHPKDKFHTVRRNPYSIIVLDF